LNSDQNGTLWAKQPQHVQVPQTSLGTGGGWRAVSDVERPRCPRKAFEELARPDSTFLERFAALPKHGTRRRFIARSLDDLYFGRPDMARDHAVQLSSGWWMGTNYSVSQIEKILRMERDVAEVEYGSQLALEYE
jgi:hypothetical protein